MTILTQLLPTIVFFYWTILAELFAEVFTAGMLERCHNHLLVKLSKHLDFQPIETACAAYRHQSGPGNKPTYPIPMLVRCLLVKYLYCLSTRETEQRLYSDMLVRWFVGLTALTHDVPDHTTLDRFDLWVRSHHPRIYFDSVLKQIDEMFPASCKLNQVGDTYAMIADAAEEDLSKRLRHMVRRLLEEAVKQMPAVLPVTVSGFAWHALYGIPQEKPICSLDKAARHQRIETVVLAAHDLHQRFTHTLEPCSDQAYPDVRLWVGYLGKVLHDEVIILDPPSVEGERVHRRTAAERRNDPQTSHRLISATDPEATYRMHGVNEEDISFGYNVQVAASTDGFIRETQAYTGAVPDQAGVAPLIAAQIEHQDNCPPKLIYDMAAGTGKTRSEVEHVSAGKTQLVAKQIPADNRSDRFGPYDFSLSEDGQMLTCPNGKSSDITHPSACGDGREFLFHACQCWLNGHPPKHKRSADLSQRCPLWERCRSHRQGPGATHRVFISDYRNQVLAAYAYNQTEAFQTEIKLRPRIERIIFEVTHYNGARRCRGRGTAHADWQAKMAAASYNLKLWMRKIGNTEHCTAPAPA